MNGSGKPVVFRSAGEMRAWALQCRSRSQRIALVPTMGALHDGHLSLVERAHEVADVVVVSIFVNPTQFGPNEDLARYPRDLDADLSRLSGHQVSTVFAPSADAIYPTGFDTTVTPGDLSRTLCGLKRPGHFEGVATVVTILLRITLADAVVMGEKDYQQLQIVRRMIRDLWLDVEVVEASTIRDPDGLAMSSRNRYLTTDQRQRARSISTALHHARAHIGEGVRDVPTLKGQIAETLERAGLDVEYIQIVHPESLQEQSSAEPGCVVAVAALVGSTRLIDHVIA